MTGANPGYRARMVLFPATGDGLVVVTNGEGGGPLIDEIVRGVAAAFEWPALRPEVATAAPVPADELAAAPGTYRFGPGDLVIRVRATGGALELALPWTGFAPLRRNADGSYRTPDGARVELGPVGDGRVREVVVVPPGQRPLRGEREGG